MDLSRVLRSLDIFCLACFFNVCFTSYDALAEQLSSPYLRCTGETGRVPADIWQEVKHVHQTDVLSRERGICIDPRSDSLESLHDILDEHVLADLDAASEDCVFGVVALMLMTLHITDAKHGLVRAREVLELAGQLFFKAADLLETTDWTIDFSAYHAYRALLGLDSSDCSGSDLRVFIYDSTSDLAQMRLKTSFGMMGAASHIHAYLHESSCVTTDPEQADVFFIPAYHGDQYNEMLEVRVHANNASQFFPYLARRRGVDHVFVVGANLPSWSHLEPLRHAMMLTVESSQSNDGIPRWYSPWKDVMIPGYIDRWRIAAMRRASRPTNERGFILAFHGNHPGTHHLYVKHNARTRTMILDSFTGIPDCSVGPHVQDFFERMGRSHFCLVPRGSSAWTIHLYESFFFGCIPVILSDEFEMPFQELVDWPSFSIKWPEDEVGPKLLEYLRAISLDKVAQMKAKLEQASCYFDFHRGWGRAPQNSRPNWVSKGQGVVALGSDCPYLRHGDSSRGIESCLESCEKDTKCNLVNFRKGGNDWIISDCVLRSCDDPAQPTLVGGALEYEVWVQITMEDHYCSPYAAILRTLESRVKARPFSHGAHWL